MVWPLYLAQLAMGRVKMSNAVKVLLAFSKPFWPAEFFDIICTGALVDQPPCSGPSADSDA